MARTELPNGVILPAEYSDDWYEDMTSNLTKLDDVIGSDSEKLNSNDVAFLRMSSAALTDGGTGNFSDLNSSNKLKTGDYVLDSGRKLYQIVSVDSTNETFTVGNSLFKITAESDLAPVAESGDYDDLDNKPDLKPVATSGDYDDLTDLPTYGITRFCSSAITDNSSVAFSAISSTNKIKVGDFLLDTTGKMYQISSVDTVNETVSVTTPLTQLAVDSDVIHKTGNETKSGELTLNDTLNTSNIIPKSNNTYDYGTVSNLLKNLYAYHAFFRGQQQGDEYSGNARTNLTLLANRDIIGSSGVLFDTFRENTAQGTGSHILGIGMKENSIRYEGCRFSWLYDDENSGYIFALRPTIQGTNRPIKYELGNSTSKWTTVNGLNPGSLSLPDLSNGIDISGYLSVGASTNDSYTAPANGYIGVIFASSSACGCYVYNYTDGVFMRSNSITDSTYTNVCGCFIPILKNQTLNISTRATESVVSAKFFPCQGNV